MQKTLHRLIFYRISTLMVAILARLRTSRYALATAVLLLLAAAAIVASECGSSSGNTFWTQIGLPSLKNQISSDGTNIFWSQGSTLASYSITGGNTNFSVGLPNITLGRPVRVERYSGDSILVAPGSDGSVYAFNQINGSTVWSRNVRRATCVADSIVADPVVQLRARSDASFNALVAADLVIVGTYFDCGTTTANRIHALDALTGNIKWTHNGTATYQYDKVKGLAVDYSRNAVFATMDKDPAVVRSTVICLSTTNGSLLWSRDCGPMTAAPLVANDSLYVVNTNTVLYKLNPETGATIWQQPLFPSRAVSQNLRFDPVHNYIFVTDDAGTLSAMFDAGASVGAVWSTISSGVFASCPPALDPWRNKGYIGTADGRVYQFSLLNGVLEAYATISLGGTNAVQDVLVDPRNGGCSLDRLTAVSADGLLKNICIPWLPGGNDKALVGGQSGGATKLLSGCSDFGAPLSGLVLFATPSLTNSLLGATQSCLLRVSSFSTYAFSCVSVDGQMPAGMTLLSATASDGTLSWSANGFTNNIYSVTPCESPTIFLTYTSSVLGNLIASAAVYNSSTLHGAAFFTNIVAAPLPTPITIQEARMLPGGVLQFGFTNTPTVSFTALASTNAGLPIDNWTILGVVAEISPGHFRFSDLQATNYAQRFYRVSSP